MRHAAPTPSTTPAAPAPPTTTVGAVHLAVADVERSAAFYRELGLELLAAGPGGAALGAGGVALVVLEERPGARPARGVTGLFHLALLLPTRADLARWLHHAAARRLPVTGLSDHFVSEAVYLDDPDGHGIEVYADRPRALWEGRVRESIVVAPLDTAALLATVAGEAPAPYEGMPAATRMGHVHLRVRAVAEAVPFYRDVLGLELMGVLGTQAAFLGAGGYHHHVGINAWGSAGAGPAGPEHAALLKATLVLPDAAARDAVADRADAAGVAVEPTAAGALVRDPSGTAIELLAAA